MPTRHNRIFLGITYHNRSYLQSHRRRLHSQSCRFARLDDSSLDLQAKLDEEFAQLSEDRRLLREFIFPRTDPSAPRYLPVNLHRIVQNAIQIFHIDRRKPSDLEPAYIIDAVRDLCDRLIVVRGDDPLSKEAQANATLLFLG